MQVRNTVFKCFVLVDLGSSCFFCFFVTIWVFCFCFCLVNLFFYKLGVVLFCCFVVSDLLFTSWVVFLILFFLQIVVA